MQGSYLLFRRVRKLILATPVIALLDAGVGPQCPDCTDVLLLKRRDGFVVNLFHQLAVLLLAKFAHSPVTGTPSKVHMPHATRMPQQDNSYLQITPPPKVKYFTDVLHFLQGDHFPVLIKLFTTYR